MLGMSYDSAAAAALKLFMNFDEESRQGDTEMIREL